MVADRPRFNKTGFLVRALQIPGVTERMIYGSDWPLQFFPVVSSWYHVNHIGIRQAWRISRIRNEWDRDIKLKAAMRVPETVFARWPRTVPQSRSMDD